MATAAAGPKTDPYPSRALLISTYASAVLICVAALIVGRAILFVLGRRELSWLEPAVGLAALLAVCSLVVRLPGRATTTLIVLLVLIAASLLILRGEAIPRGLAIALPVAVVTLLLASVPFIASGHIGVLGVGVNNDLAMHLDMTAWLQDPVGLRPTEIKNGYPIGPHGLCAAISEGIGAEPLAAMLGLILALPVLIAISALAVLSELSPVRRTIAAVFTALIYMAAATLGIGGFKELTMALLVLGFALAVRDLSAGKGDRRALLLVVGLLMVGMIAVYSYPGVAYAIAIAGAWGLIEFVAAWRRGEQDELIAGMRRALPMLLIPLGVLVVIGIAELPRIIDFRRSGAVGFVADVNSRLKEAVSPLEALGVWPSGDFLFGTGDVSAYLLFGAIGLIGLGIGIAWALREGERALLAGLVGAALIYLAAYVNSGFYVQAKALVIVAPVAALLMLRGMLGPWAERSARPAAEVSAAPTSGTPVARTAFAVVFLVLAGYSTFLALRDSRVAPPDYEANQLEEFRAAIRDKTVLSLTNSRFSDYHLRGADVLGPGQFAEERILPRQGKLFRLPVDFDSVAPAALDRVDFAVTTAAAYKSAPPPNFREVDRTDSFVLWKRAGRSPMIGVLPEEERPGSFYDCKREKLKGLIDEAIAEGYTTAVVQPKSEVGKRLFWEPDAKIDDGDEMSQALELPPGRWQLSLQYYSPVLDLTVEADGLRTELPATADGGFLHRTAQGPFWPIGAVRSTGQPIEVTVTANDHSGLQKLLGVDQAADVGNITAAQPEKARTVPIARACDQYVDHYFGPVKR